MVIRNSSVTGALLTTSQLHGISYYWIRKPRTCLTLLAIRLLMVNQYVYRTHARWITCKVITMVIPNKVQQRSRLRGCHIISNIHSHNNNHSTPVCLVIVPQSSLFRKGRDLRLILPLVFTTMQLMAIIMMTKLNDICIMMNPHNSTCVLIRPQTPTNHTTHLVPPAPRPLWLLLQHPLGLTPKLIHKSNDRFPYHQLLQYPPPYQHLQLFQYLPT